MSALIELAERVTDEMVEAALRAPVPGGSEVWWWLPTVEGRKPHENARVAIRRALEAALKARAQQGGEHVR